MRADDIMKEFGDRLSTGLDSGKCRIDDVERMMSEAIEQFKGTITARAEEILGEKLPQKADECIFCGHFLKKTKLEDKL